ncbi:DUF1697 domain-containing protein [Galactobacter caseinivorans]|uniref:DUF1697 domain-containing protein n=1 Tax=Galactobacter caseinivorans TaxID=2676123 RepID=A0A496PIV7_9MICC|nr:DUF1697 domain-containing protein [Galactobacter caseinivorans]RKW70441.1 DUF1697 domain-containing protein [Galactobacter caseinivorans]
MSEWVALLRGVNVGGVTVRSADLKELFQSLGFEGVRTVLATGNVLFSAAGTPAALKAQIETELGARFGYDAWIVLEPRQRLARIVSAYPFDEDVEHHAYVVFGSNQKVLHALGVAALEAQEPVSGGEEVLYWACPKGSSTDTAFAKMSAQPKYKPFITTRNLNTVRKLL